MMIVTMGSSQIVPINKVPIGAKVVMGTYHTYTSLDRRLRLLYTFDMEFVKASKECDLISTVAIDSLYADNYEGPVTDEAKHKSFVYSNLFQYLNSTGADWFRKLHDADISPVYKVFDGFLSCFSPHELSAIIEQPICNNCLFRLPFFYEITGSGGTQFPYFRKHGIRAKMRYGSYMVRHLIDMKSNTSFCEYWMLDNEGMFCTMSPAANVLNWRPVESTIGVRPVCRVKPETLLISALDSVGNGVYRVYKRSDEQTAENELKFLQDRK